MMELCNIGKQVGNRLLLRDVSIKVNQGECVALLGKNGAGKSTILKILTGQTAITYGEIRIGGKKIEKRVKAESNQMGVSFHKSFLYDELTAYENLKLAAKLYGLKNYEKTIESLLKQFGLHLFRDQKVSTFSRGMVQRLSLARMLVHSPSILLLDEPHTGLDQEGLLLLQRVLASLKQEGKTILMVTHDLEQVVAVCDHAYILQDGVIDHKIPLQHVPSSELLKIYNDRVRTS